MSTLQVFARVRPHCREKDAIIEIDETSVFFKKNDSDSAQLETFDGFNKTFGPESTQEEVYESTVKKLILENKSSIFMAYGSTGSGKSHTIFGLDGNFDEVGVLPRAIRTLLTASENNSQGVAISMFEFYTLGSNKDKIFDLLQGNKVEKDKPTITLQEIAEKMVAFGAIEEKASNLNEAIEILRKGVNSRRTEATAGNNSSSRSHCIVTIKLLHPSSDSTSTNPEFTIVDLAGCERNPAGKHLSESSYINTSFMEIGRAFRNLREFQEKKGQQLPPVNRNFKILHFLKYAFLGQCPTSLMVNLSPSSPQPTLNVLRDVSAYFGIRFSEPSVRASAATPKSSRKPAIPHQRLPESVLKLKKRLRDDTHELPQVSAAADRRESSPAELLDLQQRVGSLVEENRRLQEDNHLLREDNQNLRKDNQHRGDTILTLLDQVNTLKSTAQASPCCHEDVPAASKSIMTALEGMQTLFADTFLQMHSLQASSRLSSLESMLSQILSAQSSRPRNAAQTTPHRKAATATPLPALLETVNPPATCSPSCSLPEQPAPERDQAGLLETEDQTTLPQPSVQPNNTVPPVSDGHAESQSATVAAATVGSVPVALKVEPAAAEEETAVQQVGAGNAADSELQAQRAGTSPGSEAEGAAEATDRPAEGGRVEAACPRKKLRARKSLVPAVGRRRSSRLVAEKTEVEVVDLTTPVAQRRSTESLLAGRQSGQQGQEGSQPPARKNREAVHAECCAGGGVSDADIAGSSQGKENTPQNGAIAQQPRLGRRLGKKKQILLKPTALEELASPVGDPTAMTEPVFLQRFKKRKTAKSKTSSLAN